MKELSVLLAAVLLSSCASMRYGNFTQMPQGKDAFLAADAATQLTRVYPPAQNTFCIGQAVNDGFGLSLIQNLRKRVMASMKINALRIKLIFLRP